MNRRTALRIAALAACPGCFSNGAKAHAARRKPKRATMKTLDPPALPSQLAAPDLGATLWPKDPATGKGRRVSWQPADEHTLRDAVAAAEAATLVARSGDASALSRLAGRYQASAVAGTPLWLLSDPRDPLGGYFAMLVRAQRPRPSEDPLRVLQAPHARFDRGTGRLALDAMTNGGALAPDLLLLNTLHRYAQADGSQAKAEHNPADACHSADHPLTHATEAIARVGGPACFLQVHGFGPRTDIPAAVDAIVSNGTRTPGPAVAAVQRSIHPPGAARAYGTEIRVLGATTNMQGRVLIAHPRARFVHVELSAGARKRLGGAELATWLEAAAVTPS